MNKPLPSPLLRRRGNQKPTVMLNSCLPAGTAIQHLHSSFPNRPRIKSGVTILLSVICFLSFPSPLHAQTFDLSISPPLTHILIKPDTSVIQAFNIKNYSNHPVTLTARLVPFSPGSGNGIARLNFNSNPQYLNHFSLANANIQLNQPFTLQAGSSDQLVLMIKFPKNTILSDYYTSLVVSLVSPDQDKLTGTQLSGSVIANILTSVNLTDNPDVSLSLTEPSVTGSLFRVGSYHVVDTLSPVSFSVTAKNQSPFLTTTTGSFSLNINNQPRLNTGFKPIYLLAYSERLLESSESAGFVYHPHPFDTGLSSASFVLGQGSQTTNTSIKLIFFPVKVVLGLVLIACLFAFIFPSFLHLDSFKKTRDTKY